MTDKDTPRLVSVIIPTYNREKLVRDALESVYRQTHRPLEVVVVDDGSTDGTEEAVGEWSKAHEDGEFELKYTKQENGGGNVARNRGIAEARGPIVAFLDSDDTWREEKIEKQMRVLEADGETGAVYCGVQQVDAETGREKEVAGRDYPSGWLLDRMLVRDVTAPTSAYLVRRAVFDEAGRFDTDLQARQDWDMWIRVAEKNKIGCVPECLVEYRDHGGSRTASDPTKEIRAYGRIMEKYAGLRMKQPWRTRRAAEAAYHKRMGRVHFHSGLSRGKALSFHLRSLLAWPFDFDSWAAFVGTLVPGNLRRVLHRSWNRVFGRSRLAIRSH